MSIRLTGMASGLDTDSMVKELVNAYSTKLETFNKQKTKLEWKQEKWKDMNTKVYGFYSGSLSSMRMASSFSAKKNVTVSDSTKAKITAGNGAANGTQTVEIKKLAKAAYLTGGKVDTTLLGKDATTSTTLAELGVAADGKMKFQIGDPNDHDTLPTEKFVEFKSTDTLGDVIDRIKEETGLSASFDKTTQRIIIHSESGAKNDFRLTADGDSEDALESLGLLSTAQKQDGSDSKIVVNGATFESDSNSLTVAGVTIEALGVTDTAMTINVSTDTDGIYDMIKSFVGDYNSLINEMTKGYNAESAKDYEPLSDDEKSELSEKEVEKWEGKIKDSLFRRDEQLGSIINAITNAMAQGVVIDGKTYHLSDFGIDGLGITYSAENEQNAYHIAGDKDDKLTADKADKLKAMIASNPELVQKFFNKVASNVYDSLHTKMTSTTLRSAYTVYNDKEMNNEMKELKSKISDWETKVSKYEESWYKKFSKMETALTKLQSQTQSLASLLGSSN